MEWDASKPWYHGSPAALLELQPGSTITQDHDLARIFSHKPPLVSQAVADDGQRIIKHSGILSGFLYRVVEPVEESDVVPVPNSTMGAGQEWYTTRPLRIQCIATTLVEPHEQLTEAEIAELYQRQRTPATDLAAPS
jgi:hypothetical protein